MSKYNRELIPEFRRKDMNYQELEQELKKMSKRSTLFKLIKQEMKARGHWKPLPRGKAFQPGQDERRYILN